ncbi:hypothetical protein KKB99_01285, partial [bacterium]|nr:hypothetical protein [bacterium]MBU1024618.1 hypothetical protein [bacterium]
AVDGLDATELGEVTGYNFTGTNFQPYMRAFAGTGDPFGFVPGSDPVPGDNRYSHGESGEVTFILSLEPGAGAIDFDIACAGSFGASAVGKANRTPANVAYFKAFRSTRPFINVTGTTDGDSGVPSSPTLDFTITHAWAGLTAAADTAAYKAQANNGVLLPVGGIGPGPTDLTFACRLVDDLTGLVIYNYAILPTPTGTGTDADPWVFNLVLDDPAIPGTPIPNDTYDAFIYVLANVGDYVIEHPHGAGDNYTFFYAEDLVVNTV